MSVLVIPKMVYMTPPLERINWNTVLGYLQLPLLLKVKVKYTSLAKAMSYTATLKGTWVGECYEQFWML